MVMVQPDIADAPARSASYDILRETLPRRKVETYSDIDAAPIPSASHSDPREASMVMEEPDIPVAPARSASSDNLRETVPRRKAETYSDIDAALIPSSSHSDPRELPRVKVETDIAAVSTPSVSGCDTMDCYKSDLSHTSEVKIEIDVAEETPLSWTMEDPMQSKLFAALHSGNGLINLMNI